MSLTPFMVYTQATGCGSAWLFALVNPTSYALVAAPPYLTFSGSVLSGEATSPTATTGALYSYRLRLDLDPYDREYSNAFNIKVSCTLKAPVIPSTIFSIEIGVDTQPLVIPFTQPFSCGVLATMTTVCSVNCSTPNNIPSTMPTWSQMKTNTVTGGEY